MGRGSFICLLCCDDGTYPIHTTYDLSHKEFLLLKFHSHFFFSHISLFSQYGFTFASVSVATAYSIYRRPKNGMSIMLMSGAAGTMVDFLYGCMVACSNEVRNSQEYYIQQKQLEVQQEQQRNIPPSLPREDQ
jgi:hypothetical protein